MNSMESIKQFLSDLASKASVKTGEAISCAKTYASIADAKRELKKTYCEIGKMITDSNLESEVTMSGIQTSISKAQSLRKLIASYQEKLEANKQVTHCPHCDKKLSAHFLFCPYCGADLT